MTRNRIGGAIGLIIFCGLLVRYCFIQSDAGKRQFFSDQMYHHLTMRALGQIPYGGADTGEVLETIKHIRSGDSNSWFESWKRTADRVARQARATLDPISRGRALLRAHNYYRTAEFLLDPNDRRRPSTWAKNIAAFYEGLDRLAVKYKRIRVPYGRNHLNALYFPGRDGLDKKPLIVACGGFDSTMEELYFAIVAGALERGYSVLIFEGPGQGSVLREQKLVFTPQWEQPTRAVLDTFLASHPQPRHIVLLGMSMGGYLAPRAAAFDARIEGVVAFDVLFDVAAAARSTSKGAGVVSWLRRHGLGVISDGLMRIKMRTSPFFKWGVSNSMWVMGLSSPSDVPGAFDAYTLKGVAEQIQGDVLILAGAEDQMVPLDQVAQFRSALTHAKSVTTAIYDIESGGKEHCQDGAVTLWHMTLFDWLLAKYSAAPM